MLWSAKGIKILKNTKIENKTSVKENNKEITKKSM